MNFDLKRKNGGTPIPTIQGAPFHHSVGASCTEGVCMSPRFTGKRAFGFTVRQIRRTVSFS